MKRVTQRVDPEQLGPVLTPHARAALALDIDGHVEALPALYEHDGDAHWVAVAREAWTDACDGARAVLVLDDGQAWFELRAVTLRGRVARYEAAGEPEDRVWLSFEPAGAIAWDYGALREEEPA